MVDDGQVEQVGMLFWGFVEWFFSLPHLPSILFSVLFVLVILVGLLELIRRI